MHNLTRCRRCLPPAVAAHVHAVNDAALLGSSATCSIAMRLVGMPQGTSAVCTATGALPGAPLLAAASSAAACNSAMQHHITRDCHVCSLTQHRRLLLLPPCAPRARLPLCLWLPELCVRWRRVRLPQRLPSQLPDHVQGRARPGDARLRRHRHQLQDRGALLGIGCMLAGCIAPCVCCLTRHAMCTAAAAAAAALPTALQQSKALSPGSPAMTVPQRSMHTTRRRHPLNPCLRPDRLAQHEHRRVL